MNGTCPSDLFIYCIFKRKSLVFDHQSVPSANAVSMETRFKIQVSVLKHKKVAK